MKEGFAGSPTTTVKYVGIVGGDNMAAPEPIGRLKPERMKSSRGILFQERTG